MVRVHLSMSSSCPPRASPVTASHASATRVSQDVSLAPGSATFLLDLNSIHAPAASTQASTWQRQQANEAPAHVHVTDSLKQPAPAAVYPTGLNLTEAAHVVLIEPLLDVAAEAQAVGRVHRIGQRRETHVHR